jgi:hypothetical protein
LAPLPLRLFVSWAAHCRDHLGYVYCELTGAVISVNALAGAIFITFASQVSDTRSPTHFTAQQLGNHLHVHHAMLIQLVLVHEYAALYPGNTGTVLLRTGRTTVSPDHPSNTTHTVPFRPQVHQV